MINVPVKNNLIYAAIFPPNWRRDLRFYGYIRSFSSVSNKGPFDILPQHENFLTTISGKVSIVDETGEKREFDVEKAVVEASNNIVKVFISS